MEKRKNEAEASNLVVIEIESWVTYSRNMTYSLGISQSRTLSTTKNACLGETTGAGAGKVVGLTEADVRAGYGLG